jgi:hypothetical protein
MLHLKVSLSALRGYLDKKKIGNGANRVSSHLLKLIDNILNILMINYKIVKG